MVAHTNKNFISNPFIQQDLQQRELDVVQREISVLLKEQTLESHHQKGKKKKKSKGDKIGSPRNFEHFVAVRRGDGGLKVSSRKVIENSILPISNRPFVGHNSDSEPETSNSSNKGLFRRFRKAKVRFFVVFSGETWNLSLNFQDDFIDVNYNVPLVNCDFVPAVWFW